MFKKVIIMMAFNSVLVVVAPLVSAANYKIDQEGQHAFVNFRINHLGYSWLYGTFRDFSGTFTYDKANPVADKVKVIINTTSIDTNHAQRNQHIRSADLLNVEKFPQASFVSSKVIPKQDNKFDIEGNLMLHGVTKSITINAELIGEGSDSWGNYRAGFYGTTTLKLKDFDINHDLGPASETVEMTFSIEGIRQ